MKKRPLTITVKDECFNRVDKLLRILKRLRWCLYCETLHSWRTKVVALVLVIGVVFIGVPSNADEVG